jgi:hypothetical protein
VRPVRVSRRAGLGGKHEQARSSGGVQHRRGALLAGRRSGAPVLERRTRRSLTVRTRRPGPAAASCRSSLQHATVPAERATRADWCPQRHDTMPAAPLARRSMTVTPHETVPAVPAGEPEPGGGHVS